MNTLSKRPTTEQMSPKYVALTVAFVAILMISNVVGGKLVEVGGYTVTAATFLFPIMYLFSDIMTEVYGFQRSRFAMWLGFSVNAGMALLFMFAVWLPAPEHFAQEAASYATVMGMTPRLVIGSLIAFFSGEFLNSALLSKMKVATRGKHFWFRSLTSTGVGEAVDTSIFLTVAFYGVVPNPVLWGMILTQYTFKVIYAVVGVPVLYSIVGWFKRTERTDVYDRGISYNPFSTKIENGGPPK